MSLNDRYASVVCMYVCMYVVNIFNIFFSETTGPIKVKFHMKHLWDGSMKICSTGPGLMTKMADMAIYGKNLKKSSFLAPKGR